MRIVKPVVAKLLSSVNSISDVFKEGQKQKKWSAKRSVSGVLCAAAVSDITINGIGWENVALSFIAVLPLCFSVFQYEGNTCKTRRG